MLTEQGNYKPVAPSSQFYFLFNIIIPIVNSLCPSQALGEARFELPSVGVFCLPPIWDHLFSYVLIFSSIGSAISGRTQGQDVPQVQSSAPKSKYQSALRSCHKAIRSVSGSCTLGGYFSFKPPKCSSVIVWEAKKKERLFFLGRRSSEPKILFQNVQHGSKKASLSPHRRVSGHFFHFGRTLVYSKRNCLSPENGKLEREPDPVFVFFGADRPPWIVTKLSDQRGQVTTAPIIKVGV